MDSITYVGLDVHKATVCVALAESGRGGEVRQAGSRELSRDCAEAGRPVEQRRSTAVLLLRGRPLWLWVAPVMTGCGHVCVVVTPSLISIKAGDRAKTDRCDAVMLAKLHWAGELTPIWIPFEQARLLWRVGVKAPRGVAGVPAPRCPRPASPGRPHP
jgi:transposase